MNVDEILNTNLTDVSTSYPVLESGSGVMTIKKVEIKPSKKGGHNTVISLTTTEELPDVEGNTINPPFGLTSWIGCTPSEKYTQESINRALAQFQEAAMGEKLESFGPLEQYEGQEVFVTWNVEDYNGSPTNRVQSIRKIS